jgi:hypothetical protein
MTLMNDKLENQMMLTKELEKALKDVTIKL